MPKNTIIVLLLALGIVPGATFALGEIFAEEQWLASITYIQADDAINFDTTGPLPPQVKAGVGGEPTILRLDLAGVRVNPEIYTLAPRDGVIETIRLEGKKERRNYWVEVTVVMNAAYPYEVERRQVEGGVSQVILRLKDVGVKHAPLSEKDKTAVYARPAADAAIVGFMPYHAKVKVLDYAKGMYLIRTDDELLGWLPEKFMKIEGENPWKKPEVTPPESDLRGRIVATAKHYLGVPYVWGGTSNKGFDCSGLVQTVFAENGVSLPRGSGDQYREGKKIPVGSLQPGDLIFFHTYTSGPSHVGIWIGDGKFLHAESSPRGVTITPLADEKYWNERVLGARRWVE